MQLAGKTITQTAPTSKLAVEETWGENQCGNSYPTGYNGYTVPMLPVACEWRKLPEELINSPILNRCEDGANWAKFGPCQCGVQHFDGNGRTVGYLACGAINADGSCARCWRTIFK